MMSLVNPETRTQDLEQLKKSMLDLHVLMTSVVDRLLVAERRNDVLASEMAGMSASQNADKLDEVKAASATVEIPAAEKSTIDSKESQSENEIENQAHSEKCKPLLQSTAAQFRVNPSTRSEEDMFQPVVPFEHVALKRLNAPSIIRFMDEALLHHARYRQVLPLPALLDVSIKESVTALYELSEYEFYCLSNEDLLDILQEMVKPRDPPAFLAMLDKYVTFKINSDYVISLEDYKVFYDACIIYRKDFVRILDFMSKDNHRAVPPCINQPGGLIYTFLQKIPFQHGVILFNTMPDQVFSNFDEFLEKFFALLAKNLQIHKLVKEMSYTFVVPRQDHDAMELSLEDRNHSVKPGVQLVGFIDKKVGRTKPKAKTKWKNGEKG